MPAARWLACRLPPTPIALALLGLLLAALGLRLFGLEWDEGQYLHPDERHIVDVMAGRIVFSWPPSFDQLLDPAVSGLNPRSVDPETGEVRNFAYGALPLFVTDAVAALAGLWSDRDWHAYGSAHVVGRSLSAALDTATVLAVYGIGARLFSRRVALLGAAFAALAPMSIQLAHFFTTDSWLTFFVALCLLAAIRAAESGAPRWYGVAGALFGLAMATKGSVFTLAGVVVAAAAFGLWRGWRSGASPRSLARVALAQVAVAGIAAVALFGLFEPYALVQPAVYLRSLEEQAAIVSGRFDVPYTRQYVGTTPVLYQVEQFVRWGFGPVAGALALVGAVLLLARFWRQPTAGRWIVIAWLGGYGLVVAVAEAKFLRYLAPLVPVLAVMAGLALDTLWGWTARRFGRAAGTTVAAVVLAGAALWTAGFTSIYAHEHTRLAASAWLLSNAPPGSSLSDDFWDDALPASLGLGLSATDRQFETVTIDLYADREPAEVADEIYGMLERVDYVVLSSNRVASAMPRAPWRYPVQARYYDLLEQGRLGFSLAAEFARPPALGAVRVADHDADESFINYDHPRVLVYEKDALPSRADYDRLMTWAIERPWSATRQAPERESLLLDEPVGDLPVVDDARWSADVTGNSAAALVVWMALLGLLQLTGWPLASMVFGRFGDAGWGFARLVALLVAGYLVWIGASTRLIAFRAVWAAVALALVGGVGWAAWRRWRRHGRVWRFEPGQRRTALGAEIVFWAVFGLFLLFRSLNPDGWHPIWGGEKPMEFAHLNATLRSAHFPPYDPWYADGYLNYYYYGLYLVAFCLKLTGIPSEIGFNLAQPTVMALLASSGYALVAALGRDAAPRRWAGIAGGAVGALLLVGIGNLVPLKELVAGSGAVDAFSRWTWGPSRVLGAGIEITEFPFFTGLYADLHAHVVALPITVLAASLAYAVAREPRDLAAFASRAGEPSSRLVTLTRLGLLALALGTLAATNAWDVPVYAALAAVALVMGSQSVRGWTRRLGIVAAAGAGVALLAYLFFLPFFSSYVALFGSLGAVREPSAFGEVASHLGGLLTVAVVGLVVALLPPRSTATVIVLHPVVVLTAVLGLFVLRGAYAESRPDVSAAMPALVVAVVALALGVAAWTRWRAGSPSGAAGGGWGRVALVVAAGAVATALLDDRVVLAGFLALAFGGGALWLSGDGAASRFAGAAVAAAASVGAGTELVFLADDLSGTDWYRMNTIFKFYNQVWVLLALAGAALVVKMAAVALWDVGTGAGRTARGAASLGLVHGGGLDRWREEPSVGGAERAGSAPALRRDWAWAGLGLTALVVAASLLYPLLATGPRLAQRFVPDLGSGTLNALDWMGYGTLPLSGSADETELGFVGDRAAIEWLNRNVSGSPVVAEASIGPYRCNGSRISIGTGLPTIIGWERHQQQQRYPEVLGERVDDVARLYASADPQEKLDILARYNVEYVVVGPIERLGVTPQGNDCVANPRPRGIEAFGGMVGTSLDVAFQADGTTIYRVRDVTGA